MESNTSKCEQIASHFATINHRPESGFHTHRDGTCIRVVSNRANTEHWFVVIERENRFFISGTDGSLVEVL